MYRRMSGSRHPPADGGGGATEVLVRAGHVELPGTVLIPATARGCVVFAHGSGSTRHSPRNVWVAQTLHARGFAALLFDLLTAEESEVDARSGALRFDVELLAGRLTGATDWVLEWPGTSGLPIGMFGASTGAAAALVAAARRPTAVRAVVSRGGRPDLAGDALPAVRAPTLLIVGSRDPTVLRLNRQAADRIAAPHRLVVVAGATHLFEEPGALDEVARLAGEWFETYLTPVTQPRAGGGETTG
jgi:putative phosphoribosyl transferase